MSDNINRDDLMNSIKNAAQANGADENKLNNALNSPMIERMLKNMKPEQAAKLQSVLSDKNATERMLKTPQAQMLLKKFLEKKDDE